MKSKKLRLLCPILAAIAWSGWPGAPAQAQSGAIAGRVDLPESRPKQRAFRGSAYRSRLAPDRSAQMEAAPERSRFADVVVSAHPTSFRAAAAPLAQAVHMDQQGVAFAPRVLPITVGSEVTFVNRDPFYHNVFSLAPGNRFNIGRRPTGEAVKSAMAAAGVVEVFCDIHPQMSATIVVLDTPYFTQPDSTGAYRLEGLPAGRYELRAFAPEREEMKVTVDVAASAQATRDLAFGP